MPDASIVIKATDRFSDAMKTMSDSADKFKFRGDRCFFALTLAAKWSTIAWSVTFCESVVSGARLSAGQQLRRGDAAAQKPDGTY